ncbi:MAG: iron chelate uptake ABC transporter family permease subunit, partial [Thermoplasmata archaeon]|nr:iron chelate uptake ABC transporter family permease subunit [Thermoplasmata archaeon]
MAHSMGVDPGRTRIVTMIVISLTIASTVCLTGTIGFVGLVAPHIARLFCGSGTRNLCISSGLVGALLLLVAECAARSLGGLPVGVLTALIGCPRFIILLIRQRRSEWT